MGQVTDPREVLGRRWGFSGRCIAALLCSGLITVGAIGTPYFSTWPGLIELRLIPLFIGALLLPVQWVLGAVAGYFLLGVLGAPVFHFATSGLQTLGGSGALISLPVGGAVTVLVRNFCIRRGYRGVRTDAWALGGGVGVLYLCRLAFLLGEYFFSPALHASRYPLIFIMSFAPVIVIYCGLAVVSLAGARGIGRLICRG